MLKRIEYIDLGRMDYGQCWDLQRSVFDAMLAAKRRGSGEAAACGEDLAAESCSKDAACGDKDAAAKMLQASDTAAGRGCDAAAARGEDTTVCSDKAGTLFLVEHPPVYTLGKNGRIDNLLVSEERLRAYGAEFYRTDRGGDITFHGEGQIVGYPILDLERIGIGLREYIAALEQSVIDTLAEYGIRAGRLAGASGVWLGEGAEFDDETACGGTKGSAKGGDKAAADNDAEAGKGAAERMTESAGAAKNTAETGTAAENTVRTPENAERAAENAACPPAAAERIADKAAEGRPAAVKAAAENGALRKICAIGVRASRFITMHGFALNVSTDLRRFDVINPCGFTDKGATSMARELGCAPDMEEVKRKLAEHLSENLNVKIYKN